MNILANFLNVCLTLLNAFVFMGVLVSYDDKQWNIFAICSIINLILIFIIGKLFYEKLNLANIFNICLSTLGTFLFIFALSGLCNKDWESSSLFAICGIFSFIFIQILKKISNIKSYLTKFINLLKTTFDNINKKFLEKFNNIHKTFTTNQKFSNIIYEIFNSRILTNILLFILIVILFNFLHNYNTTGNNTYIYDNYTKEINETLELMQKDLNSIKNSFNTSRYIYSN